MLLRAGAQVGQASAIIQPGMARSTTMQGRAGLGHARAPSLSWQEEAATCDAYRPIYPCDASRNVLPSTPSGT